MLVYTKQILEGKQGAFRWFFLYGSLLISISWNWVANFAISVLTVQFVN